MLPIESIESTPLGILRYRRRSGFSLIIVLIISLVGLAIVGITLQLTVLSAGSGRVASASNMKYNLLQDAVEEGKAALKKEVGEKEDDVPRYSGSGEIKNVEELLIDLSFNPALADGVVLERNFNRSQLGKLGIDPASTGGNLTVGIYYMGGFDVDPTISSADLKMLPPKIELLGQAGGESVLVPPGEGGKLDGGGGGEQPDPGETGGSGGGGNASTDDAGVYLIRASLVIHKPNPKDDERSTLDTAVIQMNAKGYEPELPPPTGPTSPTGPTPPPIVY